MNMMDRKRTVSSDIALKLSAESHTVRRMLQYRLDKGKVEKTAVARQVQEP